MTEPNDHPMDKYIGGEGGWNDFTSDEQAMLGSAIAEAAKLHPGWLTRRPAADQSSGHPYHLIGGNRWLTTS